MDDDGDDDVVVPPPIEFGAVFEVQPDPDPALETSPRVIELVSREHAPVLAAGLGLLGALVLGLRRL